MRYFIVPIVPNINANVKRCERMWCDWSSVNQPKMRQKRAGGDNPQGEMTITHFLQLPLNCGNVQVQPSISHQHGFPGSWADNQVESKPRPRGSNWQIFIMIFMYIRFILWIFMIYIYGAQPHVAPTTKLICWYIWVKYYLMFEIYDTKYIRMSSQQTTWS